MSQKREQTTRQRMSACMTVAAVAALAVFPLLNDGTYSHITRTKWYGALGLAGLCVLCALTAVLIALLRRDGRQVRWHPVCLLGVTYVAWVGVSAWLGPMGHRLNSQGQWVWWMGAIRYEGLAAKLVYLAVFLSMALAPVKKRAMLGCMAAALTIFVGIAALQYAGENPLGLFPSGRSVRTNYEFQSTIGNIDMVSGYLSLVTPMLLVGFVLLRGPLRYGLLLAGLLGLLLTLCMEVQSGLIVLAALLLWTAGYGLCHPSRRRSCLWVLTLTALCMALRKGLLLPWLDGSEDVTLQWSGTVLRLLCVAVLLATSAETWGRTTRFALRPAALAALLAAAALAGCVYLACTELPESKGGLYELSELLHGRAQDSFGSYRLGTWRLALRMAAEHPWVGTGPNTFVYAMQEQLAQAGLSFPETFDSAHNGYITMLAENGIPALLLYVGLLGTAVFWGIRAARRQPWLWMTTLALVCYAVQDFFSFSICLVAPMFWAVLGMHMAAWNAMRNTRKTGGERQC